MDVWEIAAILAPQADPDFFTKEDMKTFFSIEWKVNRNSNRMAYRLQSYQWQWARKDGGIAGMHSSNISTKNMPWLEQSMCAEIIPSY